MFGAQDSKSNYTCPASTCHIYYNILVITTSVYTHSHISIAMYIHNTYVRIV